MVGESEAQRRYHRHEMQLEHAVWRTEVVRRHQDDQLKFLGINLFEAFDDGDMFRQSLLQIVRSLVADFHQQGCWLAINECKNAFVHVVIASDGPVEALCKCIERPESGIVALSGNHLSTSDDACDLTGQIIRPSDMS